MLLMCLWVVIARGDGSASNPTKVDRHRLFQQGSPMERLITLLSQAASEIKELEVEAKRLLYQCGDQQGYYLRLRQKAILLSGLADEVMELDVTPRVNALIQEKIGGFSFEADRALRLDSVFYMAVLLYPEEHQEGGANELEMFVHSLQEHLPRQ